MKTSILIMGLEIVVIICNYINKYIEKSMLTELDFVSITLFFPSKYIIFESNFCKLVQHIRGNLDHMWAICGAVGKSKGDEEDNSVNSIERLWRISVDRDCYQLSNR